MRLLAILAVALVSAVSLTPVGAKERGKTYLLSIDGLKFAPGERTNRFSIDSWGVDFLAICHIPPGWRIKAGRSAAPDGRIEGEATHGATYIQDPAGLHGLALVRLWGPVQEADIRDETGVIPATFAGSMSLIGGRIEEREAQLDHRAVRLAPAAACPPPRL